MSEILATPSVDPDQHLTAPILKRTSDTQLRFKATHMTHRNYWCCHLIDTAQPHIGITIMNQIIGAIIATFLLINVTGCTVLAVADAAASVAVTAVKVGADVVGTTVDIAASGAKAVVGSNEETP
ncbi:hypothetical protein CCP3SC1_810002 [Gammaproteobacteria bacterium]